MAKKIAMNLASLGYTLLLLKKKAGHDESHRLSQRHQGMETHPLLAFRLKFKARLGYMRPSCRETKTKS